jgi:glutathione S-transferase
MNNVYFLILLALVQYIFLTWRVGSARVKYGIDAPRTTGNDAFERVFRVQQNTLEQLMVFIPGILLFAHFVSPLWALLPGALYIVGRQMYARSYATDARKRGPGATLSILASMVLVLGAIIGFAWQLVQSS